MTPGQDEYEDIRRAVEERKKYERYRAKRARFRILVTGLAVVATTAAGFFSLDLPELGRAALALPEVFKFSGPILLAIAGIGAALAYLTPASQRTVAGLTPEIRGYIDFRVEALSRESRVTPGFDPKAATDAAVEMLRKRLESTAIAEIVHQIKADTAAMVQKSGLDIRLEATRSRLMQEVQDLARRGNLNLALGITTTLAGLLTLAIAVANLPATDTVQGLVSHFMPRLSLSVLIEIFAYFFLKLYRQSLGEIKYFQNELTNVEAKQAAALLALESGDKAFYEKVALSLASTERNFVLQRHETTVDLERERIASKGSERALRTMSDAVRNVTRRR